MLPLTEKSHQNLANRYSVLLMAACHLHSECLYPQLCLQILLFVQFLVLTRPLVGLLSTKQIDWLYQRFAQQILVPIGQHVVLTTDYLPDLWIVALDFFYSCSPGFR